MVHFDVIHLDTSCCSQSHDLHKRKPFDELEEMPTGELREISAGNSGSDLHPVYLLVYSSLTNARSASG